ncbi:hypothetical protein RFW18_20010 [Metabacillus idriensis]|uniref:hypothetical protein n=1 Tax=Metabacillus idriensis TaxID=324768 RepID=UPI002813B913|nr:hypothetical protein [Metabacillus idriensis]MDR0140050.1 hypothetical protein [Metabacillus idriensis]
MAEIWIQEELTEKFLDEADHHMRVDGSIQSIYFMSEGTEGDYVERNQKFLQDFLIAQDKYPLYLTFIAYDDHTKDIVSLFKEKKIEYTLTQLEEKRTYYTLFKKHHYHPPCFTVKIMDSNILSFILEETYWLPAQNEFYSISYDRNLSFHLREIKEWGRKKERSIPVIHVGAKTTFITISHDGAGFYLFSNEDKYSTVNNLCSHLPEGTIITQINDTLLDGGRGEK